MRLLALLVLLATPTAADTFLGIPLARQPFVKFCPDGSIVGSLGATLRWQSPNQFGGFAYDAGKDRTEFLRRGPDFEARLAENPCVQRPIGRRPAG